MSVDEPVCVMGHAESATHVAAIMLNFTDELMGQTEIDWLLSNRSFIFPVETIPLSTDDVLVGTM